ncbi:putative ribonuclease H-like domain-containing protein [Tanacetum coccineum]
MNTMLYGKSLSLLIPTKSLQEETGKGVSGEGSAKKKGRIVAITTEDMQKRRNDVKARTTLLLALPDEHHSMSVLIEPVDLNQKFLSSLAPEWLVYIIVGRNIDDLDTMSLDDVYNNLKVYEPEVQKSAGSNSQNMAFAILFLHQTPKSGTQRSVKDKTGLGLNEYTVVPPPPAQVYSPPKNDLSWTVGNVLSKPMISFVKENGCPSIPKVINTENSRKPTMKYTEMYRNTSQSPKVVSNNFSAPIIEEWDSEDESEVDFTLNETVRSNFEQEKFDKFTKEVVGKKETPKQNHPRGNQRNWNNQKSQQLGSDFVMQNKACYNCGSFEHLKNNGPFRHGGGKIIGKGTIKTGKLEFENVYFVKELKYNLFSVSQICDNKNSVLITDSECLGPGKDFKLDNDTHVLLRAPRQHNMYSIDLKNIVPHKNLTCLIAKASEDESMLWHRRLGHLNFKTMNKLVRNNLVKCLPSKSFKNIHTCVTCLKGKQHKASYKTKLVNSFNKPLHTLHMDLFGLTSVSSLNHKWYCLVVTNDFSRFTWTFFLKSKDETSSILRNFIKEIENLKDLEVKIIRCDNGGEFRNKEMDEFCTRKGIKKEFSNARTPQQNGVAEGRNRTLIEAARTMLADAKLLVSFWAEVVNTVCYVQNRVLVNKTQNKTPYELFNGRSPAIGFLRPFGCHVMILNTLDHLGKFDAKGDEGYFVGYSLSSKAFRVFNKRTKKIEENLHVDFLENQPIEKGSGPHWLFDIDSLTKSMNYVPVVVAGTSSTNISGTKEVANQTMEENVSTLRFIALPNWEKVWEDIPTLYLGFVGREIGFRKVLVDCPKGVRPIGTKWVLKNKRDERGIVVRNKARLVAQRYTQEEGIDYKEVFAPVARIEAIRLFLAYASYMGFTVYQMDVKSAFLYGTIDEEVYVMQPLGFQDSQFPDRVYKVVKAMYGLHQAPRAWYGTLSKYLLDNGFQRDDIIFGSSNPKLCREFETLMHDKFQMSAICELNFFLGLQVLQKKGSIFLSQDKYVVDILKKFRLLDVRSANTPMDREHPWGKDGTGKDVELHLYRSMIGSLMYLTASRLDIMYLKGHPKLGLWYPKESPFDLVAYSDSDYGGATQDRKSTIRGCQFLGRRLISWQCKKQTIMATFTTKSEYVAVDNAICIVKNPVYHSRTKHIEIRHHFIRDCYEKKLINVDHIHSDDNVADLLTKAFDVGRFQYLVVSIRMLGP